MDAIIGTEMDNIVDIIKIVYICIFTYYLDFKLINKNLETKLKNNLIIISSMIIVAVICRFIKNFLGFLYHIILMILFRIFQLIFLGLLLRF